MAIIGSLFLSRGLGAKTAQQVSAPNSPKVYTIVTVTLRPGKDAEYLAMMPDNVLRQAKSGLRLAAACMIQFGSGNRHIQIWERTSAEAIRKAAFESGAGPINFYEIVEREDIEIAADDVFDGSPK